MKKGYQSPKVEKIEFQYAETVVASVKVCDSGYQNTYTQTGVEECGENFVSHVPWSNDKFN